MRKNHRQNVNRMNIELDEKTFGNIHTKIIDRFEQSDDTNKDLTKEEVKAYITHEITNEIYEKWKKTDLSLTQKIIVNIINIISHND